MEFEIGGRIQIAALIELRSRLGGGVGEAHGESVALYPLENIFKGGLALAQFLKEDINGCDAQKEASSESDNTSPLSFCVIGGDCADVAVSLVAASALGCELILCEREPKRVPPCAAVFSSVIPKETGKARFIALEELRARILGALAVSTELDPPMPERECKITFWSDGEQKTETYRESELYSIAVRYREASELLPTDCVLSTLSPSSKEGFFGGFLTPILFSKRAVFTQDPSSFLDSARLTAPTKLITRPAVAQSVIRTMRERMGHPSRWQRGYGSHPVRAYLDRLFPRTVAARRRLRMTYIHYAFGGKLRSVITTGALEREESGELFRFGVLSGSFLSVESCAIVGFRRWSDTDGIWRLARGIGADMCSVGVGGIGTLTFFGSAAEGVLLNGHTERAGELRVEFPEKTLLVSRLCGFPAKKRRFFAKNLNSLLQSN